MKNKIKYLLFVVVTLVLMGVNSASALVLVPCGNEGQSPCTFADLLTLVKNVINFGLVSIAIPVSVIMVIYGGILMIFSATNPGNVKKGKDIIKATAIGLVMAFGAWAIVSTIISLIT